MEFRMRWTVIYARNGSNLLEFRVFAHCPLISIGDTIRVHVKHILNYSYLVPLLHSA